MEAGSGTGSTSNVKNIQQHCTTPVATTSS